MRGALVVLLSLAACHAEPEGPARAANLILISIDTLRADRLGCYGAAHATSPALDAFAARSVRFERAYAAAPWTLPSHVTMLSGLLPRNHGVDQPDLRPGADTRLLAEALRDAGFYTFAHTDGDWLGADFGLDRGFLSFEDDDRELAATLADVRDTIDAVHGERPFFAFVHTYDVHCPYTPGPPYDEMFASDGAQPLETAGRCGNPDYNALDLNLEQARFLADRYDGGIRRADDALGSFLAFLDERGVLRDTVVVITSDHGEEFLDHGRIGHEESVYPELLHVPLIVHAPGYAARVCAEPVGLVDLAPTLVELLGAAALVDVDGRSLSPLLDGLDSLDGAELAPRAVRAELAWKRRLEAWIDGTAQIIASSDGLERYDLARDPLAQVNVADAETAAELERLRAREPAGRPRAALRALPGEDAVRTLRALGYTGR